MAALSRSAILQRLRARLVAVDNDWHHTRRMTADAMQDSQSRLHQVFQVRAGRQESYQMDRQRASRGTNTRLTVFVRFGWRLQGDNHVAAYDAALDGQAAAMTALLGASRNDLHIYLASDEEPDVTFAGDFVFMQSRLLCDYQKALS